MNKSANFLKGIYKQRHLIVFMAKREFIARYMGTLGGSMWAILNPLITVVVFYFVFSLGFKVSGPGNQSFLLYFVCGLIPWLMFNEVINASTNGIRNNLSLIKKTVFPSEILPFVYILSFSISHLVFFIITIILLMVYNILPSIYIFQIFFYYLCLIFLMTGMCWILSALNVFHRDVGQGVPIVLNILFWMTPLIWSVEMVPERYKWIYMVNPLAYIIEGYRKSLLYQTPVWDDINSIIYFIIFSSIVFIIGAMVFHKFKMEFADAL